MARLFASLTNRWWLWLELAISGTANGCSEFVWEVLLYIQLQQTVTGSRYNFNRWSWDAFIKYIGSIYTCSGCRIIIIHNNVIIMQRGIPWASPFSRCTQKKCYSHLVNNYSLILCKGRKHAWITAIIIEILSIILWLCIADLSTLRLWKSAKTHCMHMTYQSRHFPLLLNCYRGN